MPSGSSIVAVAGPSFVSSLNRSSDNFGDGIRGPRRHRLRKSRVRVAGVSDDDPMCRLVPDPRTIAASLARAEPEAVPDLSLRSDLCGLYVASAAAGSSMSSQLSLYSVRSASDHRRSRS